MKWQPIETAPMEGGPVLVYCPKYDTAYTAWSCDGGIEPEHSLDHGDVITHWMHLPEPPE